MLEAALNEQVRQYEQTLPHTEDGQIDFQALTQEQHETLQMYQQAIYQNMNQEMQNDQVDEQVDFGEEVDMEGMVIVDGEEENDEQHSQMQMQ